jgi:hypothetical protein
MDEIAEEMGVTQEAICNSLNAGIKKIIVGLSTDGFLGNGFTTKLFNEVIPLLVDKSLNKSIRGKKSG